MTIRKIVTCFLAASLIGSAASASIEVNYTGSGAANGLKGTAVFDLVNANQLSIVLTNNSVSPFGSVNGDASMVLSSINFNLGSVLITGGSAVLNGSSSVVTSSGAVWATDGGYNGDLNDEYGYSNTGIGNATGSPILVGVTAAQVNTLLQGAATSHSNGGNSVTTFNGSVGGVGGGLDFGLVAAGSSSFGNKIFVLDSLAITLNLSGVGLSNLDFLNSGSYVEFGSNYAYVGGVTPPVPASFPTPEPTSVIIWGSIVGVCCIGGMRRPAERATRNSSTTP